MKTSSSADVVIVGGRVAGAATAMLLARAGLDVVVLERTAAGSDTLSTHALMRAGIVQLARWGLLDQVVAAGTPPIRRTTFHLPDETIRIDIAPSEGVDALYAPRRTVLDGIVADAAFRAGATLRHGVAVSDLSRDRDGRIDGVVATGPDGVARNIPARLVVGADGLRSTVASLVGAPAERIGTGASAVTYGYWTGLDTDGYEWNFRPRAASGVIPTNGGAANVFVSAPVERIGRGEASTYAALLAESSPALAERVAQARPVAALRTFSGRPGHLRRAWGAGWALVGDAGYFKDPLSAHGISDALRDAELLARAVIASMVHGADEAEALRSYQAQRDALSSDLFDVVDTIAGHRWSGAEIGPLLRRLSTTMVAEVNALTAFDRELAGAHHAR